ncbi:putative trichothecene efflux pump [Phaeomoniella chlamydospora]|uniref:Putative trichothecene efflux pump n=1 Tax=Phaeomoniella chlamydospora TaxID=158046 RepID=A0A0G2EXU5_PHACM|nr:putative trichothecene efflux pump [Phaeomoniella chlamydospora]
MDAPVAETKLKQLELSHANEDTLADIKNSDALATEQQELEAGYFLSARLVFSVLGVSLSTLATYWGFSPAAAVLTTINADIGPTDNDTLFSIIWSTCSAISVILFGRISDKFGRRWFLIGASVMGFIGGIIACTAQTMTTLVGANVLLGLGAGVHTCYSLTVGEICPNKYKFLGVAFCVLPSVIPTGFGAYLGAMLVHTANWRWIYYIYIIVMGVSVVLQVLFYRPPSFRQLHGNSRTVMQEVKRIDFVGCLLLVAGLCLFLLGISWGGQPLPWTSSRILGLVISGGVLLVVFVLWEIYSQHPNPLVPMHFFKDVRGFLCLNVIAAVSGTTYIALSILWPSQVNAIYSARATSWQSTAWLSTTIAFGIWGGIVTLGPLVGVVKHVRYMTTILMAVSVAFLGGLASCNSSNFGQSAAFSFLATYPAGILELIPGILVQLDSNDADLGTAFSIVFLIRAAFGTIMTAVFVAILSAKATPEIISHVTPAALEAGLPQSSLTDLFTAIAAGTTAALEAVPGMTTEIEAAVADALSDGYAAAYSYVYYAAVAVGIVGLIACISLKDYDSLFTGHVSRQIYKPSDDIKSVDESTEAEKSDVEKASVKEPVAQETSVSIRNE